MNTVEDLSYEKYVGIASLRSRAYVPIKSGAIQRWAIKNAKEYYTLTTTLWKKAGLKDFPLGAQRGNITANTTLYFEEEYHAREAAQAFVHAMKGMGIV